METCRPSRIIRILATWVVVITIAGAAALEAAASPPDGPVGRAGDVVALTETEVVPAAPLDMATTPATGAPEALPEATTTVAPSPTAAPAPPAPTTSELPAPVAAPAPSPTSSTAPPAPEQKPQPQPAPAPASQPATAESDEARLQRAFAAGTPAVWRNDIPVRLEVIEGQTSWAHSSGVISIARSHVAGDFNHLTDVIAHEFGHLIAFEYGSGAYVGAGPEGWPAPPERPEEAWADCVQRAFTGRVSPSHGLGPCGGEQLSWAQNWLAAGPPR